MTKAEKLTAWALSKVGSPFVMGGTGKRCTPAYRKARATQYPGSAAAIEQQCQVMSGKKSTCDGCKYDGMDCYDCAQLVRYGCKASGIDGLNISGANSQWVRGDWDEKGAIADMPEGAVCILYRQDRDGRMGHTGICLGDGSIVHAKGHAYGVVRDLVSAGRWTHYAIPKGMRSEDDGQAAGEIDALPTLRKGSKGEDVVYMQKLLNAGRYGAEIDEDGIFGSATEARVEAFQREHGLTVDGIVGPMTWAALEYSDDTEDGQEEAPDMAQDEPSAWDALVQEMREVAGQAQALQQRMAALIEAADGMNKTER